MSEIDSRPQQMSGDEENGTLTDTFVSYLTTNENIVITLTYPGSWSVSPTGPLNGYNATAYTVGSATNIIFDFTGADYTQTATFTFTEADDTSGPYTVTMSAPS